MLTGPSWLTTRSTRSRVRDSQGRAASGLTTHTMLGNCPRALSKQGSPNLGRARPAARTAARPRGPGLVGRSVGVPSSSSSGRKTDGIRRAGRGDGVRPEPALAQRRREHPERGGEHVAVGDDEAGQARGDAQAGDDGQPDGTQW